MNTTRGVAVVDDLLFYYILDRDLKLQLQCSTKKKGESLINYTKYMQQGIVFECKCYAHATGMAKVDVIGVKVCV